MVPVHQYVSIADDIYPHARSENTECKNKFFLNIWDDYYKTNKNTLKLYAFQLTFKSLKTLPIQST